MNITTPENRFNAIRPGDEHFTMTDGIKIVPRASIEIGANCPTNIVNTLNHAIQAGWIKPVAHIKTKELFWEVLEK